jgi:phosphate transport system substrate-binding protein
MKKVSAVALCLGMALLLLCTVQPLWAQEKGKQVLRVNGAGMSSDLVDKWSKKFAEANPDVSVIVVGSSAGKGFQALLNGAADIAMMSRAISASEKKAAVDKGVKLAEKQIGYAALALVTSPRNPVGELSLDQVKKLYTGEYSNWNQVGGPDSPVRCLSRRIPESGGAVFFWNKVLNSEPFGKGIVFTESWETIVKICGSGQDLPIGIVPQTRNLSSVKVLAVKKTEEEAAVLPKEESINSGSYPIILPFSFAWDERSEGPALKKFVDYCRTQGGRN